MINLCRKYEFNHQPVTVALLGNHLIFKDQEEIQIMSWQITT
jgi:hypothetical protein